MHPLKRGQVRSGSLFIDVSPPRPPPSKREKREAKRFARALAKSNLRENPSDDSDTDWEGPGAWRPLVLDQESVRQRSEEALTIGEVFGAHVCRRGRAIIYVSTDAPRLFLKTSNLISLVGVRPNPRTRIQSSYYAHRPNPARRARPALQSTGMARAPSSSTLFAHPLHRLLAIHTPWPATCLRCCLLVLPSRTLNPLSLFTRKVIRRRGGGGSPSTSPTQRRPNKQTLGRNGSRPSPTRAPTICSRGREPGRTRAIHQARAAQTSRRQGPEERSRPEPEVKMRGHGR